MNFTANYRKWLKASFSFMIWKKKKKIASKFIAWFDTEMSSV